MKTQGVIGAALLCMTLTTAGAEDLPVIPFGLPEDPVIYLTDPVLAPQLEDLAVALYLWVAEGKPATFSPLADALQRGDAAMPGPHTRIRAEWLARSLDAAEAVLGSAAARERAWLAVAIERQLAANAFVFEDFFVGTSSAGIIGVSTGAREAALTWALDAADRAAAAGDQAAAAQMADLAFAVAQTLAQGPAARAAIRPLRPAPAVQRMDDAVFLMRSIRALASFKAAGYTRPDQSDAIQADLVASDARRKVETDRWAAEGLDLAGLILPRPVNRAEVGAALDPEDALVLAVPGEMHLTVFVVTRDAFHWHRSPEWILQQDEQVSALMAGLVQQGSARSAVPLPDAPDTPPVAAARARDEAARALYDALLRPAEAALAGKTRLQVVATGSAGQFPWALMRTGGGGDADWLVTRHAVVVVPATELVLAPPDRAASAKSYLGLGDPDYGLVRGSWAENAPGGVIADLVPLPESAAEVAAVGALYPAGSRLVLTGPEASEDRLFALSDSGDLASRSIVHLATHGLIWGDHDAVIEDFVALSPAATKWTYPDLTVATVLPLIPDGALTTPEIRRLRLGADLVILSACKTASGQSFEVDGPTGLAAAFLHAGARRVMASHWPVNSRAAVEIVTAMMAADPGLQDPARALRAAMLGLIAEGGRKADPAYWAPFSIIGAP